MDLRFSEVGAENFGMELAIVYIFFESCKFQDSCLNNFIEILWIGINFIEVSFPWISNMHEHTHAHAHPHSLSVVSTFLKIPC